MKKVILGFLIGFFSCFLIYVIFENISLRADIKDKQKRYFLIESLKSASRIKRR